MRETPSGPLSLPTEDEPGPTPYQRGDIAYGRGEPITANPYQPGTFAHGEWWMGYDDAASNADDRTYEALCKAFAEPN